MERYKFTLPGLNVDSLVQYTRENITLEILVQGRPLPMKRPSYDEPHLRVTSKRHNTEKIIVL